MLKEAESVHAAVDFDMHGIGSDSALAGGLGYSVENKEIVNFRLKAVGEHGIVINVEARVEHHNRHCDAALA